MLIRTASVNGPGSCVAEQHRPIGRAGWPPLSGHGYDHSMYPPQAKRPVAGAFTAGCSALTGWHRGNTSRPWRDGRRLSLSTTMSA